MIPFPIIVGCGRSGTTLLKRILTTHPDLSVTPESYFMVSLGKRRDGYGANGSFQPGRLVDDLFSQRHFVQWWHMSEEDVRAVLDAAGPADYADAIRVLSAEYARRQGKERYGNKTPTFVRHMPFLAGLWPESRFLHIIRDGRDVALSYLDIDFGPSTLLEGALLWKQRVAEGRRDGRALGEGRYMEVLYEDLIGESEPTVKALCDFVGLEFDPGMLRYFETNKQAKSPYHQHLLKAPTKVRDWREELTKRDLMLFEAVAGELLGEIGYERVAESIPTSVRLRAAREQARVKLTRRTRRAKSAVAKRLKR